jgi:glutathione peroxidase
MKRFLLCLAAAAGLLSLSAQTVYDFNVKDAEGRDVALSCYKGKVLLIVNTATHCGFTPQYKELEALYQSYAKDGLEILDFPCNQFGGQAPGTMQEIRQFCAEKYDTHFPQFEKIDINGSNASPLFTYLKSQKGFGGFDPTDRIGQLLDKMLREKNPDYTKSSDIMWNFTKFLVSRDGRVMKRYEPTEKFHIIEADIKKYLAQPATTKKNK